MSRKQLAAELVIPAKAGIQSARLWIPASAGKTRVGGRADGSPAAVKPYARQSDRHDRRDGVLERSEESRAPR